MIRISIIIPVFNVENYIERCLLSVLQQDYEGIELIIVDDCSPDKSMSIAENLLKNSRFTVKFITHKQNSGLSAARNSGIRNASGNYLYFLDSDDELYSANAISTLVRIVNTTHADCVIGNYQQIKREIDYISKRYSQEKLLKGYRDITHAFAAGDIPIMAWNKLISKDFLLENELFFKEGLVNEDELWTFRLILDANSIALTGTPTYRYYVREGSIMTDKILVRLESAVEIYSEMVHNALCKTNDVCIWEYLGRFAFKRYMEIFTLPVNKSVKKIRYSKLRSYQKKSRKIYSGKYGLFLFHLIFPKHIGFYIMQSEVFMYMKLKNLHHD